MTTVELEQQRLLIGGEWSRTPPGQRRALLNRAADLLWERAEQTAQQPPRHHPI